jgi:hypothetical protein|tara:strand:+ start:691 stop:951 length:261 start_codon:yes stop_codon:yes gene_type:complete
MNYYILTKEVFETIEKENVHFMRKNIDDTERLVVTTDLINDRVRVFNDVNTCSSYTFTNHSDWVGDGTGVEVEEIEEGGYIPVIDD